MYKKILATAFLVCIVVMLYARAFAERYVVNSVTVSTDWDSAKWSNYPAEPVCTPCTVQTAMANAQAGDTVYFRGGTYQTGQSSGYHGVLEPVHSGEKNNPITFRTYPEEVPVFNAICDVKATGISSENSTTYLVDNSARFIDDGIKGWDTIWNLNTGGHAAIAGVVSQTKLAIMGSPHAYIDFSSGDPYEVGSDYTRALENDHKDYIIIDEMTVQAGNGK